MQFYYGNQMPLRVLDEAEFWKHQEEEHTVVIRELVANLEEEYVKAMHEWEKALGETHQTSYPIYRDSDSIQRPSLEFSIPTSASVSFLLFTTKRGIH